ncbi:MAG: diguanylate cyclase, partial [Campylobacterota bacterium]|nr:diguanylate cyclase [Campylobacterota bacterium]
IDYIIKDNEDNYKSSISSISRVIKNYDTNILVVDDSSIQLEMVKKMIRKLKLNVITAKDGQDGFDKLKNFDGKISLVLTDYHMPIIDGLELTSKIRKLYDKDELSIIVLSANESSEIPTMFIKQGANDFISKPYKQIEITTRINSNLEILELFKKTKDMANKDFMTGAFNRRYFYDSGNAIFNKAKRANKDLAVAMFDIDKFKNINDTYGHDIGDIAICEIVKVLNKHLRVSDLIARFGGEEFCILLEDITLEDTEKLFNKIRGIFEDNIIVVDDLKIKYTVSIGICYGRFENLETMVKKSDNSLYYCKENGRNQIAINK